eukprot:GEMP01059685.1.p2 GENE.GEMP01059685.1~~GEMP01059685.1.p2  ORF type:complete len:159 (+),score=25.60 GEMP01059685.1:904-1380(+)
MVTEFVESGKLRLEIQPLTDEKTKEKARKESARAPSVDVLARQHIALDAFITWAKTLGKDPFTRAFEKCCSAREGFADFAGLNRTVFEISNFGGSTCPFGGSRADFARQLWQSLSIETGAAEILQGKNMLSKKRFVEVLTAREAHVSTRSFSTFHRGF